MPHSILFLIVALGIIAACASTTEVNLVTVDKRVKNVLPHPNVSTNTWNIADWWLLG